MGHELRWATLPWSGRVGGLRWFVIGVTAWLASCGGDDGGSPAPAAANRPPTITGTPRASVVQNTSFSFVPAASDPDGDPLTFSIENAPPWAVFDTTTGQLQGTPGSDDIAIYERIVIRVSDGETTASLGPFSIAVIATASGTAVLTWTPPLQRTDGSPLNDLAGFKIYWGTAPDNYLDSVTIDNPGITTYVVENLAPAVWYFVATAYDSEGVESQFSNVASKTVL
ncbi:MAG TPA: putative Ig domain-containing protein [Vicinamibacterales bacterium]